VTKTMPIIEIPLLGAVALALPVAPQAAPGGAAGRAGARQGRLARLCRQRRRSSSGT